MFFRHFNENDIEPFVTHCNIIFPNEKPEWFRTHYLLDPDRNLNAMFLAEEDGGIISTAQVFCREMYIKGHPVTVGAIGDVTTLIKYRKRGINNRLMRMAIDYMTDNNMVTSMLYTDKPDYYARLGWFTVCRRNIPVDLADVDNLPYGYQLSPFEDGDIEKAEALYNLSSKRFDGAFTRSKAAYWHNWVAHYLIKPMALKRDGQMIAWMDTKLSFGLPNSHTDIHNNFLLLSDYASLPGKDWFLPMMAEYSRMTKGPARAVVPAPLMPDYNGAFFEDRTGMYRLNKPFMLGDKRIDSVSKLAAVLSDTLFWQTDVY